MPFSSPQNKGPPKVDEIEVLTFSMLNCQPIVFVVVILDGERRMDRTINPNRQKCKIRIWEIPWDVYTNAVGHSAFPQQVRVPVPGTSRFGE